MSPQVNSGTNGVNNDFNFLAAIQGLASQATQGLQGNLPAHLAPLANDKAATHTNNAPYHAALEALVRNDQSFTTLARSHGSGVKSGRDSASSSTQHDGDATTTVDHLGLGHFLPSAYMKRKNGDSGGSGEQSSTPSTENIKMMAQLLQAQSVFQSASGSLARPITQDKLTLQSKTPADIVNSYDELFYELGNLFAQYLNGSAQGSGAHSTSVAELSAQSSKVLPLSPLNVENVVRQLEDGLALNLLQQNFQMQQDQTANNSAMDGARVVLTALFAKMQGGDLQNNPVMMQNVVEAMEKIVSSNPGLVPQSFVDRLSAMKNKLSGVIDGAHAPAEAASEEESTFDEQDATSSGWEAHTPEVTTEQSVQTLTEAQHYRTLASANVDGKGVLSGVGLSTDGHERFTYKLSGEAGATVPIMSSSSPQKEHAGFSVSGTFAQNSTSTSPIFGAGTFSWNSGKEAIRLQNDGSAMVTSDSGHHWQPLPFGESSSYTSPDQSVTLQYKPLDSTVDMTIRNPKGDQLGHATMSTDGESVSFKDLASDTGATLG